MKKSICCVLLALAAVAATAAQAQTDVERALKNPAGEMAAIGGAQMGKHEVTFAQWDACVADGGCGGYRPDDEGWGRGNRPVINVSANDVDAFVKWLNRKTGRHYRLPNGWEWEQAASAGATTKYSWGDSIGRNRANCLNDQCGDKYKHTAPVGSFKANSWGLHDMHGNVWEWIRDCWGECYKARVIRGGSWSNGAMNLRSVIRDRAEVSERRNNVGFRLYHPAE